jgi:hypothetical protein
VTESLLVQKEATGDVTGLWPLQVGDPLPWRRLVLGRPIVRSAQCQHSLPHVHISAACPNLCPHLSSWAARCCAAGALPIASSTACCQASQSEAWWIGHALPCIEGDHCGLGEGSTELVDSLTRQLKTKNGDTTRWHLLCSQRFCSVSTTLSGLRMSECHTHSTLRFMHVHLIREHHAKKQ